MIYYADGTEMKIGDIFSSDHHPSWTWTVTSIDDLYVHWFNNDIRMGGLSLHQEIDRRLMLKSRKNGKREIKKSGFGKWIAKVET